MSINWNEFRKKLSIGTIAFWIIFGITTIVMIALILGKVFPPSDYWIPMIPIGTLLVIAIAATIVDIKSERKIRLGIIGLWTIFGITLVVFAALMIGNVFQLDEFWIPMMVIGTLFILTIVPTILEYTAGEVKFCPKCGKILERKGNFCHECGIRILMTCPSCGMKIKGNPKFCVKCGINLSEFEHVQIPSTQKKFRTEGYTKLCKQCGGPLKAEAKYCIFCGAPQ
ncbi:MAG: zinc ribbon domain-containing protein [Promethearchaeota archaeon]